MQAKNVLAKACLEYYHKYEGQKKHKAFVYAREKETGKDRCNWAYGYVTVEEAIDSAMKNCQSFMLNAECILLYTDGIFKVADGTFTPLKPVDDTPLSDEEKKKFSEEAKSLILGNCSPFFTKNYLEANGHKSFGYSIDANGHYACGYSYGNQTEKISKKRAMKSCEDNKLKRGKKAPKSPCKVYATNKQILLNAKDFGIDIEKKEEVFLSSEVYSKKLAQAKEMIDDGACLLQMKYYLRGEMQQAYYFAKDNGKQACGREEGAFTLKQAKEKAKKSCEKMAKEQKIKAKCKLFAQNFEIVVKASDYLDEYKPKKEKKPNKDKKEKENAVSKADMQKPQTLVKSLQMAVDAMNKTLPSKIDEEVRLDSVSSQGKKMTFHYTLVHLDNWSMPKLKLQSLMYDDTKSQVCSDKDTQGLLKRGASIAYRYVGKDKKSIDTFVFDAKSCGLTTNKEKLRKLLKNIGKK